MEFWAWIVCGAALLALEVLLIDLDFFLVFLGGAAILVGFADMAGLDRPAWQEWALFGVLAAVGIGGFRRRVYERLRPAAPGVADPLVGEVAVVREPIPPGAWGEAEMRGGVWKAHNTGTTALVSGTRARVERVDGLALHVRAEE